MYLKRAFCYCDIGYPQQDTYLLCWWLEEFDKYFTKCL